MMMHRIYWTICKECKREFNQAYSPPLWSICASCRSKPHLEVDDHIEDIWRYAQLGFLSNMEMDDE